MVPETKRLTLEEMDVVFGSEGVAQADLERMEAINREIGLDALLRGTSPPSGAEVDGDRTDEKIDAVDEKEAAADKAPATYA